MNHIYVFSFIGGSGGDFLCSQIADDTNFYPFELRWDSDLNRYDLSNPLDKFGLDIKPFFLPSQMKLLSDEIKIEIDNEFKDKNLILPTHYLERLEHVNLPRLIGVKAVYSEYFLPLYYTLLWFKRYIVPIKVESYKDVDPGYYVAPRHIFKIIKKITERGFIYSFEKTALNAQMLSSKKFIKGFFSQYTKLASLEPPGWITYNLDNLYLDSKSYSKNFSDLFGRSQPIDHEIIDRYFQSNLAVIPQIFNKTYDDWIKGDWLSDLEKWALLQCPDCY